VQRLLVARLCKICLVLHRYKNERSLRPPGFTRTMPSFLANTTPVRSRATNTSSHVESNAHQPPGAYQNR
jgi:hypothetical protein